MTSRTLAVVAAGGALGSLARYAVGVALPHEPGGFPWGTLVVNVVGSFLLGVLTVLVLSTWSRRPLAQNFLGVGVLGGFTTFSAYSLELRDLLAADRPVLALLYAALTLAAGLGAAALGLSASVAAGRDEAA